MKKIVCIVLAVLLISLLFAGCAEETSPTVSEEESTEEIVESVSDEIAEESSGEETESAIVSETVKKGPNGEIATPASDVVLTDEQKEKIKAGNYKAAIVLHYTGNDWSTAVVNGAKAAFEELGVEVLTVTDANFKAEQQTADVETVMALEPDAIVAMVVDATSNADAFKRAADAGIALSFMSNQPDGMVSGKDYAAVITSDDMGNGIAAADILGEQLGGKGKVGIIYYDADFYTTNQRDLGFEQEMQAKYPDIEIVKTGFDDANATADVAAAFFTKYPDLDGIYTSWDLPADGVMAAARTAGMDDLAITTIDLGTNAARTIAENGMIKGLGAQRPYEAGYYGAIADCLRLIGEDVPGYIYLPSLKVTHDNVLDAWQEVYHVEAPAEVKEAYESSK